MALNPKQDRLNRALDEVLAGQKLAEFREALSADPDEAEQYARLREVDAYFRQPPLVTPKPDFAASVMARIEAQEHLAYAPRRRPALLLGGLLMTLAVALPLVLVAGLVIIPAFTQPGIFTTLFAGFVQALGVASQGLERLVVFLTDLIASYPMAPSLLLTVIPFTMLWGWVVWYLQERNRPETIVIKVQAVGSAS
jgi:hypothetical protein